MDVNLQIEKFNELWTPKFGIETLARLVVGFIELPLRILIWDLLANFWVFLAKSCYQLDQLDKLEEKKLVAYASYRILYQRIFVEDASLTDLVTIMRPFQIRSY